ncbi:MAG: zinc-ribbon domain-containing protein [Methanomassiliicoccales archaeon]|nr:zinc-ribbon domain-containing protein [Methanomassiliicoccales archaeon]
MPYCSKCGNQVREGGQFCDRCGAPLSFSSSGPYQQPSSSGYQSSVTYSWTPDRKDSLIALILSLVLPGVGQIYVGRVGRGIFILLFMLVFGAFSWMPGFLFIDLETDSFMGFIWWSVVATVILLIVYIWQVVDAYRLAEEHNRPGNPPRRY